MKSNTRFKKNTKGIVCLNCKQPISNLDNFCSNCGQVNDIKPLNIKQYISELFAGFFAFDTRTINTIIPLLFHPGKITKDYTKGKRMKYVNPFQLYLHTSIIFLLVIGIINTLDSYTDIQNTTYNKKQNTQKVKDSILEKNGLKSSFLNFDFEEKDTLTPISNTTVEKLIFKNVDSLFKKRIITIITDSLLPKKDKDKKITKLLQNRISNLYAKITSKNKFESDSLSHYDNFKNMYLKRLETNLKTDSIAYELPETIQLSKDDFLIKSALGDTFYKKMVMFMKCKTKNVGTALDSMHFSKTNTNIFLFKKAKEIKSLKYDDGAKEAFFNKYISKASLMMFFMLPVLALFLYLFYIRNDFNYTEHLIFIFNTQTAFFIIVLLFFLVSRLLKIKFGAVILILGFLFLFYKLYKKDTLKHFIGSKKQIAFFFILFVWYVLGKIFVWNISGLIFMLVFSFYLYNAMLNYYKQKTLKTILKFILLNMSYFILIIIGGLAAGFLAFVM